jgi:hypothetical protein
MLGDEGGGREGGGEETCFLASGEILSFKMSSRDGEIDLGLFLPLLGGDLYNVAPLRKEATVSCGGDLGMRIARRSSSVPAWIF